MEVSFIKLARQHLSLMRVNLQKDRFADLIRNAYPTSHTIDENADKVISFIKSCMIVVPEKRPSVHFLQQYEIFGDSFKNVELENEDIWSKRTGDQIPTWGQIPFPKLIV